MPKLPRRPKPNLLPTALTYAEYHGYWRGRAALLLEEARTIPRHADINRKYARRAGEKARNCFNSGMLAIELGEG